MLHRGVQSIQSRLLSIVSAKNQKPTVLVVGTGWGGYRVAMDLDKNIFDVHVISPRNHFLFTPLLPSTAVGTLEFRAIQEPIRTIPNIHYYQAFVENVDFDKSVVICKDAFKKDAHQFEMKFDSIIIATGSETNTFGVAGVLGNEHVFFLKQLIDSRNIRNRLIDCFERASSPGADLDEINRLLTFVIVGGGPTSVEFAAELYDFLKKDVSRLYPDLHKHCQVKLVEASGNILGSFQHSLVGYVDKLFHSRNIKVLTNTAVKSVDAYTATLSDGNQISFGLMVWSTGIKQVPCVEKIDSTIVMKNRGGRLEIDSRLRLLGVTNGSSSTRDLIQSSAPVFAIGDCAADATKPLPALAQVIYDLFFAHISIGSNPVIPGFSTNIKFTGCFSTSCSLGIDAK